MSDHVIIEQKEAVLEIAFNRPEKKNALTMAMYSAMAEAMAEAEADESIRCVLIRAEGDMFTAGNDIGDFMQAAMGGGDLHQDTPVVRVLHGFARARKPYVAAVEGNAVGIGLTMLLHCDLAFVAEDALLSAPFVNLALAPEAASSKLLPAQIGYQNAFAIMVLGEKLRGAEAAARGFVYRALPRGEVLAAARAAAAELSARPPNAVKSAKGLMRDEAMMLSAFEQEFEVFSRQLRSDEARAAFMAFMQRRAG